MQAALDRQQLTIAVAGEARTGKSSLLKLIQSAAVADADLSRIALREVSLSPEQGLAEDEFAADDAVVFSDRG